MTKCNHILCFICLWLTACSFAPPYQPPPIPISDHYKETVSWVLAKPSLESAKKKNIWWSVYGDEALNALEQQLTRSNPSLKLAYSRFQEALALVQAARSQLYPTILANGGESRQKNSKETANSFNQSTFIYNTLTLQAYLSYEVDVWGEIRNTIAASTHGARASQFDMAAIDLSLHAELATIYFQLRGDNASQIALDKIVKSYQHALYLVHQLHQGGAVSALEEDQAVSRLEHAKTAAIDMRLERAKLQHALAVLVGEIPATFCLPPLRAPIKFVALSPQSPSTLLEQRPDVAAALQQVKAANAMIGVARAAFFPNFTLSSLVGYQSQKLSHLFSKPSLIWALGPPSGLTLTPPEISQIVFDGYYLQANLKKAKATYYETVNYYQQVVLKAFQEVEDGLVETYRLNQENQKQVASTAAAKRALYQANQRMKEGMDTYLNVVDIEVTALQLELDLIAIQTQRQVASVYLIKALGGGWKVRRALKACDR
ncbi:efflux transporter outer membrane subunit [bacterium]|nr:efflux transporter outer membrane subunit [bacterium]